MAGMKTFIQGSWMTNKVLTVAIIAGLVFLVGCQAQSGTPPPGPIGGGCG
jgi:hypothetical protein